MKRNLWKRTVSLLMSVVMLMSLVVVPAQAEGTGAPADAAGAPVQASQQEAPAAAAAAGTVSGDLAEIVTECPEGVTVEVTGDATGCWKLVQNAAGKRFAKVTDENFDSPKLNITITMPENNRYALVFDYAIDGNSWVDVYDPNWEDTKYLEDDTTKVDIDSTAFKSEAIRLAAGRDTRIFSFTGMHVSHAAYLTNLRIVKIEPAVFSVTLPKGTTATYSANGGEEASFTSDEAVNVMLYDAITVTVTVPNGQCMQGFYRSGDTTRLTYEESYTFTVTGDSASNKYIVKTLSEEGTNVDGYTAPEGLAVKTYGPHIWTLQDDVLTSGNQRIRGSDSTLAITAAKKGILIFEYKVSSNAFTDGEGYGNVLYYKTDSKPKCHSYGRWDSLIASDAINAEEAVNYSGETGWQSGSVSLEAGQTVYFSFWNDDEVYEFDGEDTAWIKNIYLSSGNVTVSVTANKAEYGAVSGDNLNQPVPEGSKQTYTAKAKDGCQFYGWFDGSDKLLSLENTYTCVAKEGITLVAKFDKPAGDYEAWNMDKGELGELASVVQKARSGDTVLLTKDTTLSTNLTIRAGVTLVVPCTEDDKGNNSVRGDAQKGEPPCGIGTGSSDIGRNGTLYRTLAIESDKTLTVEGTLVVNAVIGRQGRGHYDYDINGGYGRVVNHGTIDIRSGGAVDAFGLVEGADGNVIVRSGAILTDLFVIINWRGGTQASAMDSAKIYPMNEYKADNISSTITIHSGASYRGLTRIYAKVFISSKYTSAYFTQVNNDDGIIRLKEGSTLTRKVENGRERFAINGGADFAGSSLNVGISLTTTKFIYPFNGTYDFELKNGEYAFTEDFKFMPGATVTTSKANLTVNEGKTVVFYDAFDDINKTAGSAAQYPHNRPAATLALSDNSTLTINGTFAGTVVSGLNKNNIKKGAQATLGATTKEAAEKYETRELTFNFIPSTFSGYTGEWANNVYTWEKDKYTITFNTDGGKDIADMTVAWGETLNLPTPTKTGYTFAGWYNGETKFEAKVMPSENLILIAKWTPSTNTAYKVEHYWQNLADDGYTLHETETKTGTTGAETAAAAKSYPGFTAGTVTQPPIAADGSTVVKIYYTRNSYTLTWNFDGGKENATGYTSGTVKFGAAINKPSEDPTKTGYTFAGWSEKIPKTMPANNLTVKAQWKVVNYSISYNLNGGTDEGNPNSYTVESDFTLKNPTKEGYTFAGWSGTDISGTEKAVTIKNATGNREYTANWTANQYTITFNTDGGSEVESITQDYGTTIAKPTDPTKTGYTFAGWSEEIPATMPAGDMTVTAKWKINQYTITFDTDGGSEIAPITQDYNTAITAPAVPTKTGYTFDGWDKEIPGTMPAGDMTVTATWKINQYTITFNTDGGSEIAPITQDYGTTIAKPTDPTKTGYTFAGWYTDAACTNAWNFGSNMLADHDMTLYARWVRNAVRKATITGSVELGNRPAVGAVVELMLGNRKIAAATTDANGVYSFQTVETGLYNIVAAKDGKTRTALVNVDSAGSYTVDMIVLPGTDVSFEVRIEMPATPPAAGSEPKADVSKTTVGGLDAVADKYAESGKKVALLLTITPKTAEEVDAAVRAAIEERSAGQKIEFVDMTLSKSVDDAPATTISSTRDRLLTINIPFATSGVSVGSMAAYRCIDGKVETLTSTPNADGEFIEVRGGVLVVHTGKPATYAIGYRLRSGSSYGGTYSLTSGDGQNGKAGATLQFGVNSGGTKVSAVYVDGTQLGGGDYTVKGTIVRLKGVYTATLAQGYHFGTVYYDNGYVANFSFTLSGETSPRTADMGIGLYAALALTSLTGMAWVGKRRGSGRES